MKLEYKFNRTELKTLFDLLQIIESREDIKEEYTEKASLLKENIASVLNLEIELHEVEE